MENDCRNMQEHECQSIPSFNENSSKSEFYNIFWKKIVIVEFLLLKLCRHLVGPMFDTKSIHLIFYCILLFHYIFSLTFCNLRFGTRMSPK